MASFRLNLENEHISVECWHCFACTYVTMRYT